MPDTNSRSPTRMAGECGRLRPRETLRIGLLGSITERARRSGADVSSLDFSSKGHALDLDLVAAAQLDAARGARGWGDWEEFAIGRVHVLELKHVVDEHVHLRHA